MAGELQSIYTDLIFLTIAPLQFLEKRRGKVAFSVRRGGKQDRNRNAACHRAVTSAIAGCVPRERYHLLSGWAVLGVQARHRQYLGFNGRDNPCSVDSRSRNPMRLPHSLGRRWYCCLVGAQVYFAYSVRSAFIGEIDAARPAGMIAAKKAQIARAVAATVSAIGSQNDTP